MGGLGPYLAYRLKHFLFFNKKKNQYLVTKYKLLETVDYLLYNYLSYSLMSVFRMAEIIL
jgi:hypothetical protein